MTNRCTHTIADKCTSILAEHIKNSNSTLSDKLTFKGSLKYLLLNDPMIRLEINNVQEFEAFEIQNGVIAVHSAALSEARVSDFLLDAKRVKRQYESLLQMKKSGINSAWLLVSAYYCAFFACVEISKLFNKISLGLDSDDLAQLKFKATGVDHAAFFAGGASNFVGFERAEKLVFRSSGSKPHAAAWESFDYAFKQIFLRKGWQDANKYLEVLSNSDYSPSRIRNIWNYKRSEYFGESGDRAGIEFKKLIGNPSGAYQWLSQRTNKIPPLDPCIIPVLCEPLAAAVILAAERVSGLLRNSTT